MPTATVCDQLQAVYGYRFPNHRLCNLHNICFVLNANNTVDKSSLSSTPSCNSATHWVHIHSASISVASHRVSMNVNWLSVHSYVSW